MKVTVRKNRPNPHLVWKTEREDLHNMEKQNLFDSAFEQIQSLSERADRCKPCEYCYSGISKDNVSHFCKLRQHRNVLDIADCPRINTSFLTDIANREPLPDAEIAELLRRRLMQKESSK